MERILIKILKKLIIALNFEKLLQINTKKIKIYLDLIVNRRGKEWI